MRKKINKSWKCIRLHFQLFTPRNMLAHSMITSKKKRWESLYRIGKYLYIGQWMSVCKTQCGTEVKTHICVRWIKTEWEAWIRTEWKHIPETALNGRSVFTAIAFNSKSASFGENTRMKCATKLNFLENTYALQMEYNRASQFVGRKTITSHIRHTFSLPTIATK